MPNMYARGILFGKMVLELGDTCAVKNERHRLSCDLEFKTKVVPLSSVCARCLIKLSHARQGFFSGTYNAIVGRVRKGSSDIGEVSGRWSHVMEFKGTPVRTTSLPHLRNDTDSTPPPRAARETERNQTRPVRRAQRWAEHCAEIRRTRRRAGTVRI